MKLHRYFWPAVACAIAAAGTLEVTSALGETQTWDEGIHISAGYAYLTRGDFRWNDEHPPLVKLMSAMPLKGLGLALPVDSEAWRKNDEIRLGIELLYHSPISADRILFAARSMTMLLSLLFLASLAWWTRRRFGPAAALLAVVLCAFDPNLIAHGRYVTTDLPVTVFFFFTCVLWVEYLEDGRPRNLAAAAVVFALAMVTKFSAVLLIPILAALYGFRWAQRPQEFPIRRAGIAAAALVGALLVVVSAVYWPETVRCLTTRVERLDRVADKSTFTGRMLYRAGKWFHLPAHEYLKGLNNVATHNASGHASYLLGRRSDKGWWYYFPVVFGVKSTLAALAAAALLSGAGVWRFLRRRGPPGESWRSRFEAIPLLWAGLLFSPLFYFVFSMTSAINIGMRHILLVYPFLYVASAAALARLGARRAARYAMVALGALQMAECASIAPDYLAFFNTLSGGPAKGPEYLVDSNIDWGQDVKKLVKWLDAHGTRKAYVFYFGNTRLESYGVEYMNVPDPLDRKAWDEMDGWLVANVTPLEGVYVPLDALAPVRLKDPVARIGWTMYVYDLRKPKPAAR
ncbi:MAG: glycosyltransferase family 39 protein [Bryobacteraceae bacterium]|jgi:hypothetical protein